MPVEDLGGLTLHTQVVGAGGPPIVLLHGLLIGSLSTWYFAVAPALARAHRVVMYDLRGHGLSPATAGGYGVRAQADDLARVVERHAGDGPVTLVGHSAGGAIALRYALAHPERVARLVMVDTPLPVMARNWIDRVRAASVPDLLKMLPGAKQATVGRGGRQTAKLVEKVLSLTTRTSLLDDLLAEPDFADAELESFARPLLLCYATRGGPVVTATRARLAARVPGARLVMIEGGHALPVEAPEPLAAAILGFRDG
ncbi:MAG: alpha/beta hydrolase [Burkholderiales bacterium]